MGLASALSTALTGLNAAETTIDVVGNNIANSNTVAFKASEAVFATQFLQTQSLGSAPTSTSGGTNPRQVGLGTKVAEITPDFTQGTIEVSANPLDLALQGDGFFIVQGSQGETFYSRNGQFKINANNEITTITGQRLLGFGVDDQFQIQQTSLTPLSIPLGSAAVAQATENVLLVGTLTPTGDVADIPEIIRSSVLSDGQFELPVNVSNGNINAITAPAVGGVGAALGGAGAAHSAGVYQYQFTLADANGDETPISASFGSVTVTGAQEDINVTGLPIPGAPNVTVNVYRTVAGGTAFLRVGSTNTGTFADAVDDATIVGNNITPPTTLVAGNYSYHYTLLDSATGEESRPTAVMGPVGIVGSGRRIRIDNIVQPTSADFDQVRIYRTLSTGSTFYQVADLAAGETSFVDGASDASIQGNKQMVLDGPGISTSTLLTDVVRLEGSTYSNMFSDTGSLAFTGEKGERTLDTKNFAVTSTSTVQDLINFVEQALGIQETDENGNALTGNPGGTITADGRLQFVSNQGVDNAVEISLASFQLTRDTDGAVESVGIPFVASQDAVGQSTVADFVVFDSLGIPLNVRVTAVLEAKSSTATTYRWYADSEDNDPVSGARIAVGTGTVSFDGEGNVTAVSSNTASIDRRNVSSSSPLQFDLDFSNISGLASDTSTLAASRQDGSSAGTLSSFLITESGNLKGVFSNGVTRDLGQIRLARFANNSGLEQLGQNMFAVGVNSGLAIQGNPGEQGIGSISAGAVELSNTDIGQNLIDLILASTQYRGGTRVITSVQQLLDELMNLRR